MDLLLRKENLLIGMMIYTLVQYLTHSFLEVKMDNITKYEFKIQFADDGLTYKSWYTSRGTRCIV